MMSTASGVFTMADVLAHQEKLLKDSDFHPSYSHLMDFTHITKFELDAKEVHSLAQRSIFSPDSRRAIIANTDHIFEMSRMFEMLREGFGAQGIRVFRNLDDALDWVLDKNTAA